MLVFLVNLDTILPLILGQSQGLNVNIITRFLLLFCLLNSININAIYATDTLRFIGDVDFITGAKFQETEIGGLSGIVYDKEQKKLLAISDDKSLVNEARFYEFTINLTEKLFTIEPSAVVKLRNKNGEFFKKGAADFEGISLYGKDVLVSSEGAINRAKPIAPEFYRFSRNGDFKELLSIPEKFLLPKKDRADKFYGPRDNLSFEALSTSIDGKTTFLGSEEALFQDGPVSTINYASNVRIVLYKELKPTMEIAYQLEKIEAIKSVDFTPALNGLVDIAVIDDKNFYTMERSYLPFQNKNIIRIFKCAITDKTTDISKLDSLKDANFISVEKVLVADLDDFLPKISPKKLDNIEGIAFGPTLSNGKRSLIVVSDNNFGKGQRTLFMAFEIESK